MARGLAQAGAQVVIAGRNPAKNAAAAASLPGGRSLVVDLAGRRACALLVERVVKEHGRLDILVNNAGINARGLPQDIAEEDWDAVIETNLAAPFFLARAAHAPMKAQGGGKIVNVSSISAVFGSPVVAPYVASKAGVLQLTRSLATAWAADNIRVNAILPGWVDTDMTRAARDRAPQMEDRVLARTPAGRWGRPEDFAGVAVFLASAASDFVTGTGITVDGGYCADG